MCGSKDLANHQELLKSCRSIVLSQIVMIVQRQLTCRFWDMLPKGLDVARLLLAYGKVFISPLYRQLISRTWGSVNIVNKLH